MEPKNRFLTVLLGDWLNLAERTGTPHVPARLVTTVPKADLLDYDI